MHKKGVCHRDLKPENILVNRHEPENIKVIDFGAATSFFQKKKNIKYKKTMWTKTGTISYQAPELFQQVDYDEKIDVWSIGVMAYQMLCGHLPFTSEYQLDLIEIIVKCEQNLRFDPDDIWHQITPLAVDFIKRILKHPEKRLNAKEALNHPWFSYNRTYMPDPSCLYLKKILSENREDASRN